MYNLRYHLTSLVSVFLALALGLVLGGLIVQRGTFDRQQAGLVDGLRKEFADLRTENKTLTEQNQQTTSYAAAMTDRWVDGKLADKTVIVVSNSGRNDGLSAARAAVDDAGGKTAVITMLAPKFGLADDEMRSAVTSLAPDPERPEASIAASLAAEWASSGERPLTSALAEAGVLTVDGLENDVAAVGLIDIAAPEGKADTGVAAVAQSISELDVVVLGAQTPESKTGVAAQIADRGLSAIDTLGSDVGRYSIVALLTGAESGYYGTAQRAKAAFPPFPAPSE